MRMGRQPAEAFFHFFACDFYFQIFAFCSSLAVLLTLGFRRGPGAVAPCTEPRAIIVGDVHGCARELRTLLRRIRPRAMCDSLYFTGDIIGKGPDSLEALREVRALSLSGLQVESLMGNHEAGFLRWLDARRSGSARADNSPTDDKHERERRLWEAKLSSDEFVWLRERPLQLTLPPEYGQAIVVHAGMEPGTPAAMQRRETLITIRSLLRNGTASALAGRKPMSQHSSWAARWKGPAHLIFGHDARRKIQRHKFATGLDSGAVYGGKLSALILNAAPNASLATPPGQHLHGGRLLQVSTVKGSCAAAAAPPPPPGAAEAAAGRGARRGKGKGKGKGGRRKQRQAAAEERRTRRARERSL